MHVLEDLLLTQQQVGRKWEWGHCAAKRVMMRIHFEGEGDEGETQFITNRILHKHSRARKDKPPAQTLDPGGVLLWQVKHHAFLL